MSPPSLLGPDEPAGDAHGFEFHISDVVEIFRRRWKILAVLGLLGIAFGYSRYAVTPRMYEATAVLQIERRNLSPLGNRQNWMENLWDREFYPTQYLLLESRGLAERVVRDLRLGDDPYFSPGAAARLAAPDTLPATAADDEAATAGLAGRIRGGLTVRPVRNTQLVEVSYRSPDPQIAARLANGFAESFIEWRVENNSIAAGRTNQFLTRQIADLRDQIADKEAQLRALGRESEVVSLGSGTSAAEQHLESLSTDYNQAVTARVQAEARYRELLRLPKATVADQHSDGQVGEATQELVAMERDYATRLQTYKPDWPEMVELKTRIDQRREDLEKLIDEVATRARQIANTEYQTALRRESALAEEIGASKVQALDQGVAAGQLQSLRAEILNLQALLDELLQQQSETAVTASLLDSRETNVRIVDRALVPGGPYQPNLKKDLTAGILLGLLLGVGIIVLVEYMDRTIKSPDQAERVLGMPVLGVIPDLGKRSDQGYGYGVPGTGAGGKRRMIERRKGTPGPGNIELIPDKNPRLAISEAYRSLRTALLLSSAEELQSIAVTSPHPSEGKTSTAVNLAVVLAQLGKRVVVIDGDLRKPRLHRIFQVSNATGLVNCLTGSAELAEALVPTAIANLTLIPAGPLPPNPSELLSSDRMRRLLGELERESDIVLVDSPPVLEVTDAIVAGSKTDGTILCIAAGSTNRADARACRDRLHMADVKVLGVVLNRYRAQRGYRGYYEGYAADAEREQRADSAA